jgi:hypothetical protein
MTKNRRYVLSICIFIACVAGALGLLAILPTQSGVVSKTNFDRIETGMNTDEVNEIFGEPGLPFHGFAHHQPLRTYVWSAEDGSVAFIEIVDNSVTSKKWSPSSETIPAKLRRWLHLPK